MKCENVEKNVKKDSNQENSLRSQFHPPFKRTKNLNRYFVSQKCLFQVTKMRYRIHFKIQTNKNHVLFCIFRYGISSESKRRRVIR